MTGEMFEGIEVVMANPGRDAATEMNLFWHAPQKECMLFYCRKQDRCYDNDEVTDEKEAQGADKLIREQQSIVWTSLKVTGTLSQAEDYYDQPASEIYNFRVSLTGLVPDSRYLYRIESEGTLYEGFSFRTAPLKAYFDFGWLADLHLDPKEPIKIKNLDLLVEYLEMEAGRCRKTDVRVQNGRISESATNRGSALGFLAFSGDLVKFGNMFSNWREFKKSKAFRRYCLAYLTGNKEYYKVASLEPLERIKCYTGEWFMDNSNLPVNGPEGTEGCYFFLYGRVLFISINSCQEHFETNREPVDTLDIIGRQQEWFKKVVEAEKGSYDYIITQTHYAYFDNEEPGGGPCRWGRYYYWNRIFDECGVDLALSGDYHEYVRSERIFDDRPVSDGENNRGTVYVTYTMIPEAMIPLNLVESEQPLVARRSIKASVSAGLIQVRPEGLTFKLLDFQGQVADSTFIPAKRR